MNRADIRARILQAADMVGSDFVTTAELNSMLDASTEDLHDFLISRFGDARFAQNAWINVRNDWAEAAGEVTDPTIAWPNNVRAYNESVGAFGETTMATPVATPGNGIAGGYLLPYDFKRLVRVHFTPGYVAQITALEIVPPPAAITPHIWRLVTTGDGSFYPMRPMDLSGGVLDMRQRSWTEYVPEYRLLHGPHVFTTGYVDDADISVTNQTAIQFLPLPASRYAVQLFYVPKARLLTDDVTQFGYDYHDWLILDCAAQCMEKQQQSSKELRARLEVMKNRIQNDARTIDAANPRMVSMSSGYHPQVGTRRAPVPWGR